MITNSKSTKVENNILIKEKCANIDYLYGPYESKEAAFNVFSETENLAQGKTVGIIEGGKIVEYWWPTEDLTLDGLVQKIKTDDGKYLPITGGSIRKEGSLDVVMIDNRSVELYDGTLDSTMQLIPAGIVLDSDSGKYEITRDDLLKLKSDYLPLSGGHLNYGAILEVRDKTEVDEYSTIFDTVFINPAFIKIIKTDIGVNLGLTLTSDSIGFVQGPTFTSENFKLIWDHVNDNTAKEIKTNGVRIYSQPREDVELIELGHLDSTEERDIELVNEVGDVCLKATDSDGSIHLDAKETITATSLYEHHKGLSRFDVETDKFLISTKVDNSLKDRFESTNNLELNYDKYIAKLDGNDILEATDDKTKLRYSASSSISLDNTEAKIVGRKLTWVEYTDTETNPVHNVGELILGAVQEALKNDKTYGRKNGEWVEITSGGGGDQVQADWDEEDTSSKAYILNKPTFKTVNNTPVTGTGNIAIPALVQANWNETNTDSKAYIQNKPSFKTINSQSIVGTGDITISGGEEASEITDSTTSGTVTRTAPEDNPVHVIMPSFGGTIVLSGYTTHELVIDVKASSTAGVQIQSSLPLIGVSSIDAGERMLIALCYGVIIANKVSKNP